MISYEVYKIIHFTCLILMVGGFSISFFATNTPKYIKIISGVASLLMMVSGMGLIARIGIGHGASWPLWLKLKLTMWLVISITGPVLGKRLVEKRQMGYFIMMILFFATIMIAISKFA
jgi:uncharacterized membrane protein SirB2